MHYFTLKLIHIISSTLLFGTGLGSAFYFWRANLTDDYRAMYFAAKSVVIADWAFTTPAVIIQPVTGFMLIHLMGFSFSETWIIASLVLYVFIGICWLPVVWLQMRMRDQLAHAIETQAKLPAQYYQYYKMWFALGWPAFIAVIVIFYLMVFK